MEKRADGRQESIIDPDIPIIDAHHHLFHKRGFRYLLDEILEDIGAGHNVRATVYVESHSMMRCEGPELLRPVGETEFANGIAAMSASGEYGPCRVNAAIVSFADLAAGERVAETLDAHIAAGGGHFRGIRQVAIWHPSDEPYRFMVSRPEQGLMSSGSFRAGFGKLAERHLTFDAAVFHTQLAEVADLADDFPHTTIILNHMGFAMAMGLDEAGRTEVYRVWRKSLQELVKRQNVIVKIGGLGMPFWGFGFESRPGPVDYKTLANAWRPYVEAVIEMFGADRCMMESNFPADGHSCGYVPLWNALKTIARSYSPDEKASLFSGTASRTYNIHLGSNQSCKSQTQ